LDHPEAGVTAHVLGSTEAEVSSQLSKSLLPSTAQ
jgi:hypothetical protein